MFQEKYSVLKAQTSLQTNQKPWCYRFPCLVTHWVLSVSHCGHHWNPNGAYHGSLPAWVTAADTASASPLLVWFFPNCSPLCATAIFLKCIKNMLHPCLIPFNGALRWWRRLLRVPWTARRSNQSILKEISPEYSLEGLMLKLKLQYLATWCKELTHWKRRWCWEGSGAGEGDDRGWDGWMASLTWWTISPSSFEQAQGDGERQGSLACCSPWGHKELDTTERLNCYHV